jgi:hypothetical protein
MERGRKSEREVLIWVIDSYFHDADHRNRKTDGPSREDVIVILLHHLDLRGVVRGQIHLEEVLVTFFVPLLVNQHSTVMLSLHTAPNDGTRGRKRGHAPFNMPCREVHRRLNGGIAFLYMQNTEAQLIIRLCGNVNITLFEPVGQ